MGWSEIGGRVRECRLAAGLSQEGLAGKIGLERTKLAKIESGDRRVDAMELARLSSALGVPMSHFLRRWPPVLSRRAQLVDDTDTEAARQSYRLDASLLTWLHDVRQLVKLEVLPLQPLLIYPEPVHNAHDARVAARWVRDHLDLRNEPIETLMSVCAQAGQFVLVTDLPGEGASVVDEDVAVAVVSRQPDPGRRRTTAAHELGHLVLGDEYSSDLGVSASRADRESVVDAFAAELLLPEEVVAKHVVGADRRSELTRLAAVFRTSWSLAVRQAAFAGVIEVGQVAKWCSVAPTRAELREAVGWAPQADLSSVRVPPSYAHAVMVAWHEDYITTARAVELMHGQIVADDLPIKPDVDFEP
ncbi:ImmA/IrrE family metallo-endopeptidase [Allokutzneria sp. A3M-2-11 16]|uniref:helix-turn-helix domain-containing protein n=1 Tax=Allokutzneria sp. A3M-2-11 16 TaxID=2962043 RepID=UPI0020B7B8AC|nr:helix-turn-helix domain-containing protein [Allokutzneria sp. A3M-2-11 16]MCP3801686.1 ImmA/IrrE family metallo-endopeptidase [Allokutzneria sp. A3M-2-11 16]